MKYPERKHFMEVLNPDNLKGSNSKADQAEAHYRFYMLQLMADIADQLGGMAYAAQETMKQTTILANAYQEMLRIQQLKSGIPVQQNRPADVRSNSTPHRMDGIPPTEQSRYGGPK